jgi:hypothetical protein
VFQGVLQAVSAVRTGRPLAPQHKGEPTSLKPEGSTPFGNNGAKQFSVGRSVSSNSIVIMQSEMQSDF